MEIEKKYSKDDIPSGTIVVTRQGLSDKLYNVQDLEYMRELSVGQLFNAVARYYNKTSKDYKDLWPRYSSPLGTKSKSFESIEKHLNSCTNDLEKLNLVTAQLKEKSISQGM